MKSSFSFKTSVIELPVVMERVAGSPEQYVLREMTAANRDKYLDALSLRMRRDETGKAIGVDKFEGMQSELLICCLFKKDSGEAVTKEEVQSWPASVVSELFTAAKELNKLLDADSEKAEQSKKD